MASPSAVLNQPGTRIALVLVLLISIVALLTANSTLLTSTRFEVSPEPVVDVTPAVVTPIVFALVMFGKNSAIEGVVAMKTALMHISRPAEFHIMCNSDALPVIEDRLKLVSRPMYDVRVHIYKMEGEHFQKRSKRAGITDWEWGGILKVFLHEVLVDVERVIYFDTDMMFLVDPYILWREFDNMSQDQIVSFPTVGPKSHSGTICSCVMLLKLPEMRARPFMSSTLFSDEINARALGNNETWEAAQINPKEPQFGDQGIYWAIWKHHPEAFMHLSETWDISLCRLYWQVRLNIGAETMTKDEWIEYLDTNNGDWGSIPERHPDIFPGIIHYNCLDPDGSTWDDPRIADIAEWGPYSTIARAYKWVWLNRGDGSATVSVSMKENPPFYDELITQEANPTSPATTAF